MLWLKTQNKAPLKYPASTEAAIHNIFGAYFQRKKRDPALQNIVINHRSLSNPDSELPIDT